MKQATDEQIWRIFKWIVEEIPERGKWTNGVRISVNIKTAKEARSWAGGRESQKLWWKVQDCSNIWLNCQKLLKFLIEEAQKFAWKLWGNKKFWSERVWNSERWKTSSFSLNWQKLGQLVIRTKGVIHKWGHEVLSRWTVNSNLTSFEHDTLSLNFACKREGAANLQNVFVEFPSPATRLPTSV